MWFDSWSDLGRVVAVGAAAYVALVVLLRLVGKRTLAKLNAFDLVVTVALRSSGVGGLDRVQQVVLESDGTLSVIQTSATGDGWALEPRA